MSSARGPWADDEESRWQSAGARITRLEQRGQSRAGAALARVALVGGVACLVVLLIGAASNLDGHPIRWWWTDASSVSSPIAPMPPALGLILFATAWSILSGRSLPFGPTLTIVGPTRKQRRSVLRIIARRHRPDGRIRVLGAIAREEQADQLARLSISVAFWLGTLWQPQPTTPPDALVEVTLLTGVAVIAVSSLCRVLYATRYLRTPDAVARSSDR